MPNIYFPGTSKKLSANNLASSSREARLVSYSVRRAQEIDRDDLPMILRTCFICRKGWRKGTLINCDYCPLIYHADCLDPPLTTLPSTRWMCPNHPEPIAEDKLLVSSSFSERIKLWSHLSKPLNHNLVQTYFFDKVRVGDSPPSTTKNSSQDSSQMQSKRQMQETSKQMNSTYDDFLNCFQMYEDRDRTASESLSRTTTNPDSLHEGSADNNKHCSKGQAALLQLIESSKLIELNEMKSPANSDTARTETKSNGLQSSINTAVSAISKHKHDSQSEQHDSIEHQDWLEFLLSLAKSKNELIQNQKPTKTHAATATAASIPFSDSKDKLFAKDDLCLGGGGDFHLTKVWPSNNVLCPKNHNYHGGLNKDANSNQVSGTSSLISTRSKTNKLGLVLADD